MRLVALSVVAALAMACSPYQPPPLAPSIQQPDRLAPVSSFTVQMSCLSQPPMGMSCYVQGFRGGDVYTPHVTKTVWEWGDGSTSDGVLTASHKYVGGWMYVVGVKATDDLGETDSKLLTMYVVS